MTVCCPPPLLVITFFSAPSLIKLLTKFYITSRTVRVYEMLTQGKAAFADEKGGHFAVRDAPDWKVEEDEVKIKIRALAINPADHKLLVSATKPSIDI